LAELFRLSDWEAHEAESDYTLTRLHEWRNRYGSPRSHCTTLTLASATDGGTNVFSGLFDHPNEMGRQIREILWRGKMRVDGLTCLWRDSVGGIWREAPVTAEQLELNPLALSDEDRAAIAAGFSGEPVTNPNQGEELHFLKGPHFVDGFVVVQDEGVRYYARFRGISYVEWRHVRSIAAEGPGSGYTCAPLVAITGEAGTLHIDQGGVGFNALLNRLAALPGFPAEEFRQTLDFEMWHGEVVVWKRPDLESTAKPHNGEV